MLIKSLDHTPMAQIIACFKESFSDYFIKQKEDAVALENRWHTEGVRYDLSFGAFVDNKLVGLMLNALKEEGVSLSAFNMGIGVIKAFRGQGVIDAIYAAAIPHFRSVGIARCYLEVLEMNERAIRVYERIGFRKVKYILLLNGALETTKLSKTDILKSAQSFNPHFSSNDFNDAVQIAAEGTYDFYKVVFEGLDIGYFIVHPAKGSIEQFDIFDASAPQNWRLLFTAIEQVSKNIPFSNVPINQVNRLGGLGMEMII